MTPSHKVLDLLKKLCALAQAGVGGEKQNAQTMLDALMKKHGITEDMLDDETPIWHKITIEKKFEQLFFLIISSELDDCRYYPRTGAPKGMKTFELLLPHHTHIAIGTKVHYYLSRYEEDLAIHYRAFIYKNDLGRKSSETTQFDLTPEDIKAIELMKSMKRHEFKKQIGNG